MAEFSKKFGSEIEEKTKYCGDKDIPIATRITNWSARINHLGSVIDEPGLKSPAYSNKGGNAYGQIL